MHASRKLALIMELVWYLAWSLITLILSVWVASHLCFSIYSSSTEYQAGNLITLFCYPSLHVRSRWLQFFVLCKQKYWEGQIWFWWRRLVDFFWKTARLHSIGYILSAREYCFVWWISHSGPNLVVWLWLRFKTCDAHRYWDQANVGCKLSCFVSVFVNFS